MTHGSTPTFEPVGSTYNVQQQIIYKNNNNNKDNNKELQSQNRLPLYSLDP